MKQTMSKFVITYGALGWGLTVATLFIICTALTKAHVDNRYIVASFVLFPLGGILWAFCLWHHFKRRNGSPSTIPDLQK